MSEGRYGRVFPGREIWARMLATPDEPQSTLTDNHPQAAVAGNKSAPKSDHNLSSDEHQAVVEPLATQVSQDPTEMPTSARGDIAFSRKFLRRSGSW